MEKHFRLSDEDFEQQFATCKLPPLLFSHEAHLRLAWIHVNQYGVDQAIENITSQIKAFADFHGADNKYHATVTVAAIYAVHHFWLKSGSNDFRGFIEEFPQLKTEFRRLISEHYSFDIFKSAEARKAYIMPDLVPFY